MVLYLEVQLRCMHFSNANESINRVLTSPQLQPMLFCTELD